MWRAYKKRLQQLILNMQIANMLISIIGAKPVIDLQNLSYRNWKMESGDFRLWQRTSDGWNKIQKLRPKMRPIESLWLSNEIRDNRETNVFL